MIHTAPPWLNASRSMACEVSAAAERATHAEQSLRDGLEQLVRPEIRLPERLGHAVQLFGRGAGEDKVLGKVDACEVRSGELGADTHPITSVDAIQGVPSSFRPATTGSTKKLPKRFS